MPELVQIGEATEEVLAAMTRAHAKWEEKESAAKKEESGVMCRNLSPARVTKANENEE